MNRPLQVGLFKTRILAVFPDALRDYLQTAHITRRHREYLKYYRDALTHRIPLYVPPVELTAQQQVEWETLKAEKASCIVQQDWERLEKVSAQQQQIGAPSFVFLHDFSPDGQRKTVALHRRLVKPTPARRRTSNDSVAGSGSDGGGGGGGGGGDPARKNDTVPLPPMDVGVT